jgi:hypothetical protein
MFCNNINVIIIKRLENKEPEIDKTKLGVKSVPIVKDPSIDFDRDTIIASLYNLFIISNNAMIFDKPIFMNGIGRGINISTINKLAAIAVIIDIKYIYFLLFTSSFSIIMR